MKDVTIDVEFTTPVRNFLERRGFSHILLMGIEPKEQNDANEPETGSENYWLEPIKADDARLGYQEESHLIKEINDPDIVEMAAGKDEIQFMIRVPVEDYNDYLKDR